MEPVAVMFIKSTSASSTKMTSILYHFAITITVMEHGLLTHQKEKYKNNVLASNHVSFNTIVLITAKKMTMHFYCVY